MKIIQSSIWLIWLILVAGLKISATFQVQPPGPGFSKRTTRQSRPKKTSNVDPKKSEACGNVFNICIPSEFGIIFTDEVKIDKNPWIFSQNH